MMLLSSSSTDEALRVRGGVRRCAVLCCVMCDAVRCDAVGRDAARCGEVLGTRGEKAATGSKEGCWLDGGTAAGGTPLRLVQRRKLTGQGWQVDVQ